MARKPIPLDGLVYDENGVLNFRTSIFLAYYDEFAGISAGKVLIEGQNSIALLNAHAFGHFYQLAVALLTSHRLSLSYDTSSGYTAAGKNDISSTNIATSLSASTSSLSEGASILSLANSDDPLTADLARTGYGLQLLGLIRNVIPAGELVRGCALAGGANTGQWPSAAGY